MWVFMFFLLRKMVSMTSQLQDFYTKKENNGREMKIATELQHEQAFLSVEKRERKVIVKKQAKEN